MTCPTLARASLQVAGIEVVHDPEEWDVVHLTPGWSLGQPVLAVGGAAQTRAGAMRLLELPLLVKAANWATLQQLTNQLLQALTAETFSVRWQSPGGLPVLWQARGAQVEVGWSTRSGNGVVQEVRLQCVASTYGRSPDPITLPGAGQVVQLQTFDTAQNGSNGVGPYFVQGTGSNRLELQPAGGLPSSAELNAPLSNLDLLGAAALVVRVKWWHQQSATRYLRVRTRLSSSGGRWSEYLQTLAFPYTRGEVTAPFVTARYTLAEPTATAPAGGANLNALTGWVITVEGDTVNTNRATVYVDDLRALPAVQAPASTPRGTLFEFQGVEGTAPAPARLAVTSATPMSTVVVHRLPGDADPTALPLLAASGAAVTVQTIDTPTPSRYRGTYGVVLLVQPNGTSGTRNFQVVATQRRNGVQSTQEIAAVAAVVDLTAIATSKIVHLGFITLPLAETADDDDLTSYRFSIGASLADPVTDLLLLDTDGVTVLATPATAIRGLFLDEPTSDRDLGAVMGATTQVQADALSIEGDTIIDGQVELDPGRNRLLVASPQAQPAVAVTYAPRWSSDRSTPT